MEKTTRWSGHAGGKSHATIDGNVAGSHRQAVRQQDNQDAYIFSPWIERLFVLVWLVFYLAFPARYLLSAAPSIGQFLLRLGVITLFGALYCLILLPDPFSGPARSIRRYRLHVASIAGLALLVIALSLFVGPIWLRTFIYVNVTAGLRLPRRFAIPAVLATGLLTFTLGWFMMTGMSAGVTALLVTALGFAKIGVVRVTEINRELRAARQQIARLAISEERLRLARDLHDSVKQQMFATGMQIAAARTVIGEDPDAAERHLGQADLLVRRAQEELATIIQQMRPATAESQGLATALRTHVEEWSRQSNIPADFEVSGECEIPAKVERAFLRIAQEALANVIKHSGATSVSVAVQWQDARLTLTVADDGCGFVPQAVGDQGYGLLSMRERIEGLGGQLRLESRPGDGTRVICSCPLDGAQEVEAGAVWASA